MSYISRGAVVCILTTVAFAWCHGANAGKVGAVNLRSTGIPTTTARYEAMGVILTCSISAHSLVSMMQKSHHKICPSDIALRDM